jgi:hypothetical protein
MMIRKTLLLFCAIFSIFCNLIVDAKYVKKLRGQMVDVKTTFEASGLFESFATGKLGGGTAY